MKLSERLFWAVGIVLIEVLIFVVPVMAILTAYVLISRPSWFKNWVDRIYR